MLRIELIEPDDDMYFRADDLAFAFLKLLAFIRSPKLEILVYDFRKIGKGQFDEMAMDEEMDWELICSTLRRMRPAQPSRTPFQITMLFNPFQEGEEHVNTLRSALQDSGHVHFQFENAGV